MPPTDRFVITFAAEPPQETIPYGRWADTLREHFLGACREIDTEGEEIGEPGEIKWFPDRSFGGRTYIPAVARTTAEFELFGFVSFDEGSVAARVTSRRAPTSPPSWPRPTRTGSSTSHDDVIGVWRGEQGKSADMTLVWGVPMIAGGAMVTAELANLAVDQCEVVDERFTLIAPDNYRGDYIEVKLWDGRGQELAVESLYVDDDSEDESEE